MGNYSERVHNLNQMYNEYYGKQKQCVNYLKCKENFCETQCKDSKCKHTNCKFDGCYNSSKTTKLGKNYDVFKEKNIRILVIGQEDPHNYKYDKIDTPALIGDNEEGCVSNFHYRRTLQTLLMLCGIDTTVNEPVSSLKKYNKLLTAFCLTNYFKCAFKKLNQRSKIKHGTEMKNNCCKLLQHEIEVLDPTIIIVQGKFYNKTFWNNDLIYNTETIKDYKPVYPCDKDDENKNSTSKDDGISVYLYKGGTYEVAGKEYNKSPFFVVWAYHPTSPVYHKWCDTSPKLNEAIGKMREYIDNHKELGMQNLNQEDIDNIIDTEK